MSRILFVLICLLSFSSIHAEMIGHVEFYLPKEAINWKVIKEMKTNKKVISTTLIYAPNGDSEPTSQEFFSAHVNDSPSNLTPAAIENSLKANYPNNVVKINIIRQEPQSVIFEWSVSEGPREIFHGWTRIFSTKNETTLLTYQTDRISTVNDVRPIWIDALEEAKLTTP